MRLLVRWLVNAVALMIVAYFVRGFVVHGFINALIAAAVIGLINATLGVLLKILTFPLTIVTLGLFLIVINALMLRIAAYFVKGFEVQGWGPALLGAILLSIISAFLHWLVGDKRVEPRLEE
jgi:putative membrane protein